MVKKVKTEYIKKAYDYSPIIMLTNLMTVEQDKVHHPEGNTYIHSLQVYEVAKNKNPNDIEFLRAALLHDVGKAIISHGHEHESVKMIEGKWWATEKVVWLIEQHMRIKYYLNGTMTKKGKRTKLENHPLFIDLLLLNECDYDGRVAGYVPNILPIDLLYLFEEE